MPLISSPTKAIPTCVVSSQTTCVKWPTPSGIADLRLYVHVYVSVCVCVEVWRCGGVEVWRCVEVCV